MLDRLNRSAIQTHLSALVRFETQLAVNTLLFVRSWGSWYAVDPLFSSDPSSHKTLVDTYLSPLDEATVGHYFTLNGEVLSTNLAVSTAENLRRYKGALAADVDLITPDQYDQLPSGLQAALNAFAASRTVVHTPALWAVGVPFGSVLRRKVREGAYLYLVHHHSNEPRSSSFSLYQSWQNDDILDQKGAARGFLCSWVEKGLVPGTFMLRVFDSFGWPTYEADRQSEVPAHAVAVSNHRWGGVAAGRVLGAAYPLLAPCPGVRWKFSATPWTGGGAISFGSCSMTIMDIPWLLEQLRPFGIVEDAGLRAPYSAETCALVDEWLTVEKADSEEMINSVNKKALADGTLRLIPNGWNLQVLRTVPNGTYVHLTYGDSTAKHLYLKLSDDLWYYGEGDKLCTFLAIKDAVAAASHSKATVYSDVSSLHSLVSFDRAEQVRKAYSTELKLKKKASSEPSSWFVHWDELAHAGVPFEFVEHARSLQLAEQSYHLDGVGLPWWWPHPGCVFRVHNSKNELMYVLIQSLTHPPFLFFGQDRIGLAAQAAVKTPDGWQVHVQVLDLLLSENGQPLSLLKVKTLLRLHSFDFSTVKTSRELYAKVPRKSPEYEPCPLNPDECFAAGGRGLRWHPKGYEHPVIGGTQDVHADVVKFYDQNKNSVPVKSWTTRRLLTRVVDGHTQHLIMSKEGVHLFGKRGKELCKLSFSLLDKIEGSYKDFDLADWGLNWCKEPEFYSIGSYYPEMPDAVRKTMMSSSSYGEYSTAGYLPACTGGDYLVQKRKSGVFFAVLCADEIKVYDQYGTYRTGESYLWHSPNCDQSKRFKRQWGESLSHLKKCPFRLHPSVKEGVNAFSAIPDYYVALRRYLSTKRERTVTHTFLPDNGTIVFARAVDTPDNGTICNVFVHFSGDYAQLYTVGGKNCYNFVLTELESAYILCLSLGITESPKPTETFTNSLGQTVEIYARNAAPVGLPTAVYASVFATLPKRSDVKGHPYIGRLHKIGTTYVFNTGSRIAVYVGSTSTAVYLDDVTEDESKFLATLGFTVPPNASREAEVPTIVLHDPGQYPEPDSLKETGETLAGTYFKHHVLSDKDGDLWLWKQLPPNYHAFVVDAEECGSRLAYMILGNKSVCAQKRKRGETLGTLQPLLPKGSTLLGRDKDASTLTPSQLIQIVQQHPVAWLISDHDTHGNQFMITPDNFVVGLDKGQCFKHFGDSERLALDYWPNDDKGQQGPYFYLVYPLINSGKVDRDEALAAIAQTVVRIKFADEAKLLEVLTPFVKSRFKSTEEQESFINRFLNRKRNIDKQFDAFLSTALGGAVSLRHYARELKLANIDEIVFRFPSVEAGKVEYETIPAEYHDVEHKVKHDQIAAKHKIKIVPHLTVEYLLAAMHNEKEALEKFLAETNLKPVGNQDTGGFKKTPYGYLVAIHKTAYEKGEKVEVKKEIKTHAKTVVKAVHARGELPPTTIIADVEKGKSPLQVVDYVPLDYAFKGKSHNYEDVTVIAQVPKFPRGGANIFLGSPYVVNNYMNLLKVRVKDRFYYEISLRVDQLLLNGLQGSYDSKTYQFHARDYLPEKGVYEENSLSKGPLAYANFQSRYKLFEDDTEVWLFNDSTHTKFAMQGTIIVRIPVSRFNTGARMDKVLRQYLDEFKVKGSKIHISSLGELIVSPTDDSLKRITLMKAAFSRLSWSERSSIDVYAADAIEKITKRLESNGVNVTDLELAYLAEGHASTVHKTSAKKLFKEVKAIKAITHGGTIANVASVLKHGLLSPVERSRRGVTGAGIVNSRDFLTGGAEMIMTMLGHMSGYANRSNNVCYLVSPHQLCRTDIYFHNADHYGSINPDETTHLRNNPAVFDIIRRAAGNWAGSNELIFWHSIPTTALLGVFCQDSNEKKQVVEQLKKAGIESVNGQSVEDFVRDHKDYDKMAKITTAVLEAN